MITFIAVEFYLGSVSVALDTTSDFESLLILGDIIKYLVGALRVPKFILEILSTY